MSVWNEAHTKKCPVCGGDKFYVSAHVVQDWFVDGYGNFEREVNSCSQILHKPDDNDIWECATCGFSEAGKVFNVD